MADNNPYESLLRADTAQAMRQSMQQAADLNPDTEAKLQGLARQHNLGLGGACVVTLYQRVD